MHNTKNLVSVGQKVSAKEQIATLGTTGASTGPHIHFETIVDGRHVDPLSLLCTGAAPPIKQADVEKFPPEYSTGEPAGKFSWETRGALNVGFWDLLSDMIASRAMNPAYAMDLQKITDPARLYQEINYLEGVAIRVDSEKMNARQRIARNQAIINILSAETEMTGKLDIQRDSAIKSMTEK